MYTILINDDNTLITTQRERIMQRSKLVNSLHFLMSPTYQGKDMSNFTARLEYRLPISMEPHSEILEYTKDENGEPLLYKDMLEYKIPFDTALTKENGEISVQLSFTNTELDEEGKSYQYVRKTCSTTIIIVPVEAWCIPSDSALDAIDQRQLKVDEQIKALNELGEVIANTKADNITLTDDVLQLTANGEPIGNEVHITVPGVDDGELDGESDGILELDKIDFDNQDSDNESSDDTANGQQTNVSQEMVVSSSCEFN